MMSGERLVDDAALSVSWEGDGMGGGGPEHVDMISWTLFFFFLESVLIRELPIITNT